MAITSETYSGDVSSFLSGSYYKKSDLEHADEDLLLTIAGVERAEFAGKDGSEPRLQLTFRGEGTKKLTLNQTNLKILVKHFGTKTSGWIGKRVQLYYDENVSFGNALVGGLRLRISKAARPAPTVEPEDPEGSVPF